MSTAKEVLAIAVDVVSRSTELSPSDMEDISVDLNMALKETGLFVYVDYSGFLQVGEDF